MQRSTRALRLKPLLDAFVDERPWKERIAADPIEFPHRYRDPRDVEAVGLLSTSLAYGRVSLFKPKIEGVLRSLGGHPAAALAELSVTRVLKVVDGFVYRFNRPTDLAVLLMGIGQTLRRHGSLERAFLSGRTDDWQQTLATFTASIRAAAPEEALAQRLGPPTGLSHLLPSAQAGAAKRLNLFLRWMVRRDAVDFGVWAQVSPASLIIPLDTHVMRISRWLGLTTRSTIGWATAEEITAALRLLDPLDPVRYDFALCHFGMSGACPSSSVKAICAVCSLRPVCLQGPRVLRRSGTTS